MINCALPKKKKDFTKNANNAIIIIKAVNRVTLYSVTIIHVIALNFRLE